MLFITSLKLNRDATVCGEKHLKGDILHFKHESAYLTTTMSYWAYSRNDTFIVKNPITYMNFKSIRDDKFEDVTNDYLNVNMGGLTAKMYEDGYEQGHDDGYDEGYHDGENHGWNEGYDYAMDE